MEAFVHMVFVVLERHVFDLQGQEFAILLAVVEDLAGMEGVDVDLDDRSLAEEDQRVAVGGKPVGDDLLVKVVGIDLAPLQPQEELRAVAELQRAVFRKGIQVDGLDRGCSRGLGHHFGLAAEGGAHTFGNVEQPGAAAVHDAGFFEDVEQFGRMLERAVHPGDEPVEVGFEILAFSGGCHAFPKDGQDGAFHGYGDGLISVFHSAFHGFFEGLQVCFPDAGKSPRNTGKNAREDDAGISAGAHEHPLRNGFRSFADRAGLHAASGLQGHKHIVARIPVGDGEDVQVVDGLAMGIQPGAAAADHRQEEGSIQCIHHFSGSLRLRRNHFVLSSFRNTKGSRE